MSTEKTNQVEEGEISFEDLANSSFSFEVANFTPQKDDGIEVTLQEPTEEEKEAAAKAAAEASEEEDKDKDLSEEEKAAKAQEEAAAAEAAASEEEEEEEEEAPPAPVTGDASYKDVASLYLEQGLWEDVEVELEEGKTVKLSEIENLDKETFLQIQKAQKEFAGEDIENNYVSKQGIDENGLKLIEILQNGGDIREIFEKPEDAIRPFENVDTDNEKIQESILYQQYRMQGLSETESSNLVALAKQNLTMDDKVQQIVTYHQKRYDDYLTKKVEEQRQAKIEEQAKLKEFKKGVMENLKEGFKLKDTLARKLTNLGAEKTESGEFKIDEIYAKKMEDPKEAAELLFFLSDKEAYLKMMGAKTKRDTNLQTIRKVSILKDKQKTTKNTDDDKPKSDLEFSVPLGN